MPGTLVSHYRVLHPLGQGGMGEVYAAVDETLRRRVALKAIRAEHRLNPESKARFLREAQILSGLDHPNICRVYDYIEGDDRDWLVLELIEGKSLKVALTAGMDAYMSPEQARGEPATTASDMFSLGVMLQEMFTGSHPHPLTIDGAALVRRVQRGETEAPTGIRADLADLLRRLTSASPAARPAAVDAAERIRWIRDRPKRRLRAAAIVGALALAVLAGAKYTVDLGRERTFAIQARDEADARREQAESLIEFMLGDLRSKLEPVGRLDILDAVGERAMAYFAAVPEHALSDDELLRRSKALYQIGSVRIAQGQLDAATAPLEESLALGTLLSRRQPDNLERLFELGQSHYWVGYVHWRRGQLDPALREFQEYLRVSEALVVRASDSDDYLLELSYANSNIGSVLEARGELEAALIKFQECLRIEQALLEVSPDDNVLRRSLAASHNTVGVVSRALGRLDEAMANHRAELALQEELVRREPENLRWRLFLGVSNSFVGLLKQAAGKEERAEGHYRTAAGIGRQLIDHDPTNMTWQREVGRTHFRLGRLRLASSPRAALAELDLAVSRLRLVAETDRTSAGWQRDLAEAVHARGEARLRLQDAGGAASDAAEVLDLMAGVLTRGPEDLEARRIRALGFLLSGESAAARQDHATASAAWAQAREILEPIAPSSADYRLLEPWVMSLLYDDRRADAQQVLERLDTLGYRDAGFLRAVRGMTPRRGPPDR
ncbi:MAG: serine/threonine protein kinase [Acidobacteria bacterium]|nr:serine/threonine protein kinase [Acidobacteriota bacterium]